LGTIAEPPREITSVCFFGIKIFYSFLFADFYPFRFDSCHRPKPGRRSIARFFFSALCARIFFHIY